MEEWKEINFTKDYLVSTLGKIKTVKTGRILKASVDQCGYERVCLFKFDKRRRFKVHRLVAMTYIDNPKNLPQVNHIDGNKRNNSIDNLEWVSSKDNVLHAKKTGLRKGHEEFCKSHRKPVIGINLATGERHFFKSISDAKAYVNSNHIQEVLKGERQVCKGFTFRFAKRGDVYENSCN